MSVQRVYQTEAPSPIAPPALPRRVLNRLEDIEGDAMAVSVKLVSAKSHIARYPTHDAACDRAVEAVDRLAIALIEAASRGSLTLGEVRDTARQIRQHCADYRAADVLEDAEVFDGIDPCVIEAHDHSRKIPHAVQEICEGRHIGQRTRRLSGRRAGR
jgi:hypothetical protein